MKKEEKHLKGCKYSLHFMTDKPWSLGYTLIGRYVGIGDGGTEILVFVTPNEILDK